MKQILVTGCSGFIGQNLCKYLGSLGYTFRGIDIRPPPCSLPNLEFHQKDVLELNAHDLSGISDVIHLAARTGVRASSSEAADYFQKNVQATHHLLELCVRVGVSRFFFASSSSVYGDHPGRDEGSMPIGPEACKSFYAITKHQGEVLTWFYSQQYPIQCFCMRFFTVYGPQPRKDMLIGKVIHSTLLGKPVPFYGTPSDSIRSFTFVDDLCNAIYRLLRLETSEKWSAWNLGNPVNSDCQTVLNLLSTELSKYGKHLQIEYFSKDSQDSQETLANTEKARALLEWNCVTYLQEGIARTVSSLMG